MGLDQGGAEMTVGVTDFPQEQLGEVTFVELPGDGQAVGGTGGVLGGVESSKAASDIYSPLSGKVSAVNSQLEELVDYLPVSLVVKRADETYALEYDRPKSIGYIAPFYGNFGIILRTYAYLLLHGGNGLRRIAENAELNANYIREKLKDYYEQPYPQLCKHECVFSAARQVEHGVHAIDVAKALIDAGMHPPTVIFR